MTKRPFKFYVCERHALRKIEVEVRNPYFSLKGGGADRCQMNHCESLSHYHYTLPAHPSKHDQT